MMRTIYLFRHCETEQFSQKRCIGVTDVDLSENGLKDASRLKEYLSGKQVNHIFCSSAVRAVKTARIMSAGEIQVTVLPNLHEIDMGDWDGLYFDELKAKYPEEYARRGLDFARFSPPNGESFSDCQKRAQNSLCDILENTQGNIAVIAHAGFNRALICRLACIDLQKLFTIPQPFGCVNILLEQNGNCIVRQVGMIV